MIDMIVATEMIIEEMIVGIITEEIVPENTVETDRENPEEIVLEIVNIVVTTTEGMNVLAMIGRIVIEILVIAILVTVAKLIIFRK